MIIYKCDKCGDRVYKANMVTLTVEHSDGVDICEDEYHFCTECLEDFMNWLEDDDDLR